MCYCMDVVLKFTESRLFEVCWYSCKSYYKEIFKIRLRRLSFRFKSPIRNYVLFVVINWHQISLIAV